MSRGETDERVIHDEEVVAIQILLEGSFAKLAQSSPVPLDSNLGILFLVFGNSSEQRGITTGMIPGEPLESNSHTSLLLSETFFLPSGGRALLGQQDVLAIQDNFIALVQHFASFHNA